MGMTIQQKPDAAVVHGAYEQLMYVLTSTEQASASNFKFRYIADLYVGGVMVSRVKVYPNNAGAGVIRVDKLIQDWMSISKADTNVTTNQIETASIHTLGVNAPLTPWCHSNGENFRKVELKFGQEYSASATTNPTQYPNLLTANYISCIMTAGLQREYTWDEGIATYLTTPAWLNSFLPLVSSSRVFSDRKIDSNFTSTTASNVKVVHQQVTRKEVRTIGLAMEGAAPVNSTAVSIHVTVYDSDNAVINSGHIAATSGGTPAGSASGDDESLQYFGVGPYNLSKQTVQNFSAIGTTASYYEVFVMDSALVVPSNATLADMASCCYQFTIVDSDCMYGQDNYNFVTLAFQNSLGCWDYQTFSLLHQRSTGSIDRKTFDQVAGNWNTADASQDFNFRGDQGGSRISKVSATQEMVANTDLFNEDEVELMESLFISPNVFLIGSQGESVTPIVVTESNFVRKKNLNERAPFTYQIKFKYAKERPTTKGGTYRGYS